MEKSSRDTTSFSNYKALLNGFFFKLLFQILRIRLNISQRFGSSIELKILKNHVIFPNLEFV
jgi:hypothetical protein